MADDEIPGQYIEENKDLHDCVFLVGSEKERISTNKIFLVNYSMFFRKMFIETDMKEKYSKDDIRIPNHEPDVFKLMLSYVYGNHNIEFEDVNQAGRFHLLANQFLMPKLKEKATKYLMENCKLFQEIVECHVLFDIKEMEYMAVKAVETHTKDLLPSPELFNVLPDVMLFIVKQNILNVTEIQLWEALLKWAKNQCDDPFNSSKIREKLESILKHVRFLAISTKDFAEKVVPTSVLTKDEMLVIYGAIATKQDCNMASLCNQRKDRFSNIYLILPFDFPPCIKSVVHCKYIISVSNRTLELISLTLIKQQANVSLTVSLKGVNNQVNKTLFTISQQNTYTLTEDFKLESNHTYTLKLSCHSGYAEMFARRISNHNNLPGTPIKTCEHCTISVVNKNFMSCLQSVQFKMCG